MTDRQLEKDQGKKLDQSMVEGRIGQGRNSGVRNVAGTAGAQGDEPTLQRSAASDGRRDVRAHDPDVRVGAKGVMHSDIGESICLQPGNDCT